MSFSPEHAYFEVGILFFIFNVGLTIYIIHFTLKVVKLNAALNARVNREVQLEIVLRAIISEQSRNYLFVGNDNQLTKAYFHEARPDLYKDILKALGDE